MYTIDTITTLELVVMADMLGYTDSIKAGASSWGLRAITSAHGNPTTHANAVALGNTLARHLTGTETIAIGPSPRLHYSKTAGIASPFKGSYHPRRFAERTKLVGFDAVSCVEHGTRYEQCAARCAIGVSKGGQYLIDIVRGSGVFVPSGDSVGVQVQGIAAQLAALKAQADAIGVQTAKAVETAKANVEKAKADAKLVADAKANAKTGGFDMAQFALIEKAAKKAVADANAALKAANAEHKATTNTHKAAITATTTRTTTPTRRRNRRKGSDTAPSTTPTPRQRKPSAKAIADAKAIVGNDAEAKADALADIAADANADAEKAE